MLSIEKITQIDIKILLSEILKTTLQKCCRNGVWGGDCEIQAFSEIYSVNVNIHELESTLEPSYKFINAWSIRPSNLPNV